MSATYSQELRRIAVDTPLGKDVLLLNSFSGREAMSRLFSYDLQLMSEKDNLSAKEIVGQKVGFSVEFADGKPRYFHGIVNRFSYVGTGDRLSLYRAQVVPMLWLLTRKSNCRIFQRLSVPDILKKVLSGLDLAFELSGHHPQWEYCVQYRETDFNFVSRLMEHEGIFYYFKHEQGKHTLVLADQKSSYKDCQEKQVDFLGPLAAPDIFNYIASWEHRHEFRSGKWAESDYNFETPSNCLLVHANGQLPYEGSSALEFYDYPGEYEKKPDGDSDVRLRIEEEEATHETVVGESFCRSFSPGFKFKLGKHHCKAEEGKGYVVTSVQHSATAGGTYVSGGREGDAYSNQFTCIPEETTFRPSRVTPKPMIHGVQTAVVVGPKGEEIYTDKYGRVMVQFFWDREGKKDEKSSCWIRVAQSSAGKHWGAMSIPRIGQEVVVTFLEGDPDRPLITGVVYNAEQMPAYTLPDEMTKSYVKSNSSKDGDGFNEIRFEDKKDKEQIFIHSQRNMDTRIRADSMTNVGGDMNLTVGNKEDKTGNYVERVFGNRSINVKGEQYEKIESTYYLDVGHGDSGGGAWEIKVNNSRATEIGMNDFLRVMGSRAEKVDNHQSLTVGGSQDEKVGLNHAVEAGMNVHIKAGMSMVLEAGMQLTLKVGGNFIDISPAGVAIQGTMVLINSGGAPGTGVGAQPEPPVDFEETAPMDPVQADDSKTGQKSCKS